jgi:glycolate oxidase iron-sulfur subunit
MRCVHEDESNNPTIPSIHTDAAPEARPAVKILSSTIQTSDRTLQLDSRTYAQALGCVHCGLCLPACPTYLQTGHEAESPRGRIQLMRGLSDGVISPTASVRMHLDFCLDCRACETACPSGVVYHELIEETRANLAEHLKLNPTLSDSPREGPLLRWMTFNILTHPLRLKLAMLPLRILQRLGIYSRLQRLRVLELFPPGWQKMLRMLSSRGPIWPRAIPDHSGAGGMDAVLASLRCTAFQTPGNSAAENRRQKITAGLLTGCVGSVVCVDVNRQAVDLLNACGLDVYSPSKQRCCGAIHHHNGDLAQARTLARKNIDLFHSSTARGCDYIVTAIAGCGAMLKEYGVLLRDDPVYCNRARDFSKRVRDITQLLAEQQFPPLLHRVNLTATYHDACHLAHAQKVTDAPRELLARIPGLKLLPLHESDLCCGAAGTYNLTHTEMAGDLAKRKLKNIAATGAAVLITGNVGCAMHIQSQAATQESQLRVVHPVELLHQAAFGSSSFQ